MIVRKLSKSKIRVLLKRFIAIIGLIFWSGEVRAERLQNEIAVFTALDKVTANIKKLEVPVEQTSEFGSLRVRPYICFTNPPNEAPKTTSFVQIEEVQLDGQLKKIFSGWMFAESPGLNALEHPVFDVWLTGCSKPKNSVPGQEGPPQLPSNKKKGVLLNEGDKNVEQDRSKR